MYLHVGICDDESASAEYVSATVHRWAEARDCTVGIDCFSSAEAFLFEYEADTYDILLLDIEMDRINGVDLAKQLRARKDDTQIVFVTGYPDFIAEGYEVSALHYLMKPVRPEKLFEVLDRAAAARQKGRRYVLLPDGKELLRLPADEIVYGESDGHYVLLHTERGTHRLRMTVPELETCLGAGFFRVSRSYVAGLAHVSRVTRTDVLLGDGTSIPLGRGMYDPVSRALVEYLRGL